MVVALASAHLQAHGQERAIPPVPVALLQFEAGDKADKHPVRFAVTVFHRTIPSLDRSCNSLSKLTAASTGRLSL